MKELIMKRIGPPPPAGCRLIATLERIDGIDGDHLDYGNGPCIAFIFRPADERYRGRTVSRLVSAVANEYSHLGQLAIRMLDRGVPEDEDIAPALRSLVGTSFSVTVEHDKIGDMVHLRAAAIEPAAS